MQHCEIAIIGAGAVGLAAALGLARAGRDVVLFGAPTAVRDGRTIALLDGSWRFLAELGLAGALSPDAAPLATMRMVDDTGSLFRQPPVEFKAAELGLEAFGWNIENALLVERLAEAVAGQPSIRLVPHPVTTIEPDGDVVRLAGSDFSPVAAKLVIGADGRKSPSREAAGIPTRAWSYPQTALTAILKHRREHLDTSTEFHTRSGPCTLVPLPGRRSSLVWLAEPDEAGRIAALDADAFAREVENRTHSILGAMTLDGPRGAVPMGGLSVERFAAQRIMLAGESAHVFPPIGAQGLNLGLRDVIALCEAVVGAADPGDEAAMERYDRARRADVRMRTGAVDTLNRTLLSELLPADLMRGAGLLALARITPLRRFVMRHGLAGGMRPAGQAS